MRAGPDAAQNAQAAVDYQKTIPYTNTPVQEGGAMNPDGTWTAEHAAGQRAYLDQIMSPEKIAAAHLLAMGLLDLNTTARALTTK